MPSVRGRFVVVTARGAIAHEPRSGYGDSTVPDRMVTRGFRRLTPPLAVLGLLVGAAFGTGCSGSSFDREKAIDDVVSASGSRVSRDQAACYVDRVRDELGARPLQPDVSLAPEEVGRLTSIRVDCIGVNNLGAAAPPSDPAADAGTDTAPRRGNRGDDPQLDALWDQCEAGYGAACDQLFDRAPLDSVYESFAATCGNRSREVRCADIYPAPGTVNSSPAQPPP